MNLFGIDNPTWQVHARCAKMDPALFFQRGGPSKEAREACASCPVLKKCHDWILNLEKGTAQITGFYAGMSAKEREHLSLCLYKDCLNERKRDGTWYCSPEHAQAAIKERNHSHQPEYYMQGILHHG